MIDEPRLPGPAALHLRRATAGDYGAFAALFPALAVPDPVPDHARWAGEIAPASWVAERAGVVVAYCYCEELADSGYVRNLVVAPAARGQGVGRAVMERVAADLRARGARRWFLNVKPDNEPALRLYEGLGLRPRYRSQALEVAWSLVDDLPGEAPAPVARPLASEDEPSVERAFALPPGQIARARRPGRVPIALAGDGGGPPVGFAVFEPAFPRAFPFRVMRASLARALLQALRAHALPARSFTHVVIEDDPTLARLLVEAGARVGHEVVHLEGAL